MLLRPRFGERSHILETARAKSLDARKLDLQVVRQPVDHPGAPALGSLPGQDVASDRPVEQNQLPADRKGGPNLSPFDSTLQVREQFWVPGRGLQAIFHQFSLAQRSPTTIAIVVGETILYKQLTGSEEDFNLANFDTAKPSE